ncbi:MAG TPA: hypothetical protein VMF06_03230 [Candidatus Limnocylindria bacterium]|nr:hypothetical protein [Candidatus Limnocylindria bacterium]
MTTNGAEDSVFGGHGRPLFRIIVYCFALGFAVLLASMETVHSNGTGFGFEIGWRTVALFLAGLVGMTVCFKTLFQSPHPLRRGIAMGIAAVIGVGAFLYPLRFVPAEKLGEIFTGLAIAVGALSTLASVLYAISRFMKADEIRTELAERRAR